MFHLWWYFCTWFIFTQFLSLTVFIVMKFHKFSILYSKSIHFASCNPLATSQANAQKCSQFDLGNVRSLCINGYNFSLLIVRHLIISLHQEHRFTIIQCYFDFYLCSLSLFYLLLLISSNDNVFMLINVQKRVTKWNDTVQENYCTDSIKLRYFFAW